MRLTGFEAIEWAEKESLPLNKRGDEFDEPHSGLTIAEAEAIATEDPDLIWVEIPDHLYGVRRNIEPER